MPRRAFLGLMLLSSVVVSGASPPTDPATEVKDLVAAIESRIASGDYPCLSITMDDRGETGPGAITFHYTDAQHGRKLRCAVVTIPQETWKAQFSYFYDEDGGILSFVRMRHLPADVPSGGVERRATLFDRNGSVIWSDYGGSLPMSPEDLKKSFQWIAGIVDSTIQTHGAALYER